MPSDWKPSDPALDFERLGSSTEVACSLRSSAVPQAPASWRNRWVVEVQDVLGTEIDGLEVWEGG